MSIYVSLIAFQNSNLHSQRFGTTDEFQIVNAEAYDWFKGKNAAN